VRKIREIERNKNERNSNLAIGKKGYRVKVYLDIKMV